MRRVLPALVVLALASALWPAGASAIDHPTCRANGKTVIECMALWRANGYSSTFKISYDQYPGNVISGTTDPGEVEAMDGGDGGNSTLGYSGTYGAHVLLDVMGPRPESQPDECTDYDPDDDTCDGVPVGGSGTTGTYDPTFDRTIARSLCNYALTDCSGKIPAALEPLSQLAGMASDLSEVSDKLDGLDQLHDDLTQLHDDLRTAGVVLAAGQSAEDPVFVSGDGGGAGPGGAAGTENDPQYVKMVSADSANQVDGFNAQRQALWFMAGLVCVCFFGYFFYRQIAMRG